MPKNKAINLLPQEEFNISTTGRVLKWATGTFRIIVIITEIVVMGAFLSRFWLDAQNSELINSIKVKGAQVDAQSDLENQFRNVQSKLNIFGQINQTHSSSQKITNITSKLPVGIILLGISVSDNSAQVKGITTSDIEISRFVTNLQTDKTIKKVEVEQINSSEVNQAESIFSIKITY